MARTIAKVYSIKIYKVLGGHSGNNIHRSRVFINNYLKGKHDNNFSMKLKCLKVIYTIFLKILYILLNKVLNFFICTTSRRKQKRIILVNFQTFDYSNILTSDNSLDYFHRNGKWKGTESDGQTSMNLIVAGPLFPSSCCHASLVLVSWSPGGGPLSSSFISLPLHLCRTLEWLRFWGCHMKSDKSLMMRLSCTWHALWHRRDLMSFTHCNSCLPPSEIGGYIYPQGVPPIGRNCSCRSVIDFYHEPLRQIMV